MLASVYDKPVKGEKSTKGKEGGGGNLHAVKDLQRPAPLATHLQEKDGAYSVTTLHGKFPNIFYTLSALAWTLHHEWIIQTRLLRSQAVSSTCYALVLFSRNLWSAVGSCNAMLDNSKVQGKPSVEISC